MPPNEDITDWRPDIPLREADESYSVAAAKRVAPDRVCGVFTREPRGLCRRTDTFMLWDDWKALCEGYYTLVNSFLSKVSVIGPENISEVYNCIKAWRTLRHFLEGHIDETTEINFKIFLEYICELLERFEGFDGQKFLEDWEEILQEFQEVIWLLPFCMQGLVVGRSALELKSRESLGKMVEEIFGENFSVDIRVARSSWIKKEDDIDPFVMRFMCGYFYERFQKIWVWNSQNLQLNLQCDCFSIIAEQEISDNVTTDEFRSKIRIEGLIIRLVEENWWKIEICKDEETGVNTIRITWMKYTSQSEL